MCYVLYKNHGIVSLQLPYDKATIIIILILLYFILFILFYFILFYFCVFLGLYPWHMEVPRLGTESDL